MNKATGVRGGTSKRVPSCDGENLSLDYFAAAQAGGAHPYPLVGAFDLGVNLAEVHVPAAPRDIVRVADSVSELRPLAADITNSCHDDSG